LPDGAVSEAGGHERPAGQVIERIVAEAKTLFAAHGATTSALRETDRGVDG